MKLYHIIQVRDFRDQNLIDYIFKLADSFRNSQTKQNKPILSDKILATLFYEPSTRTRFSFESAMLKLGGRIVSCENASQSSSAVKGETLEDTIKIVSSYADAIVLRHPEIGAAKKASAISMVPIINAGDGAGEHPTQALLDLYTIQKELKRKSDFKIAFVGDLLYGRAIHSLIELLSAQKNIKIFLTSPKMLKLPSAYKNLLKSKNVIFEETDNLEKIIPQTDILYMTRVQKERFASKKLLRQIKNFFILSKNHLENLPAKSIILHPLPRVNEIPRETDSDPRACYFKQAQNGLYIRMALLSSVLN